MPNVIATAWLCAELGDDAFGAVAERLGGSRPRARRRRCAPPAGPGGSRAGRSADTAGRAWRRRGRPRSRRSPTRRYRARTLAPACGVGRRRRAVLDAHRAIDDTRPSRSSGRPSLATAGLGLTPAVHTTRAGRDRLAAGELRRAVAHLVQRGGGADLDAAPAQLAFGEAGEALGHLLHDPVAGLGEHPAHPLQATAGVQLDRLGGEVLQLGEPLDAGVSGPDEHEAEVLGAQSGSSSDSAMSRQLSTWLRSAVASDSDFSPIACSARPGIGSVRETEPSATTGGRSAGRAARRRSAAPPSVAALGVGAGHTSDHEVGAAQLRAQRDDHVARVERAPGGTREQRRVEQEVGVVDERHARALRRQQALQGAGGVEAAKAATRDHDLPGHGVQNKVQASERLPVRERTGPVSRRRPSACAPPRRK